MPSEVSTDLRPCIVNREPAEGTIDVGVRIDSNGLSISPGNKRERVPNQRKVMVIDQVPPKILFGQKGTSTSGAADIYTMPLRMLAMVGILMLHPGRPSRESHD
jgi:hypothetical protein